jgi:hypothetical protein
VPIANLGTAFIMAPGLILTCWHNVHGAIERGLEVSLVFTKPTGGHSGQAVQFARDARGLDLASARTQAAPKHAFSVAADVSYGEHVWSFGYPLTERPNERNPNYVLAGRYIRGYVMREFENDVKSPPHMSYELDMRAPKGLSGAPLLRQDTRELIGVVYGVHTVTTEINEQESFALAHTTGAVLGHRSTATEGQCLSELLGSISGG